jgi:hypothetical protein
MFITELFTETKAERIVLSNLPKDTHKMAGLIHRLAKFHNINIDYEGGNWVADDTPGVKPFMKDITYLMSAAGVASAMHEDDGDEQRKLVAVFRKGPTLDKPNGLASKIYLWKTGPGDNTYEMEVGQDRKRIPVKLSFAQIRQTLATKGFNESITRMGKLLIESTKIGSKGQTCVRCKKGTYQETSIQDDMQGVLHCTNCGYEVTNPGNVTEASMTKSVPSKKESVFNKGVEKSLGQQVAVIVLDHPDSVAYGVFKRIGETGLCHIKLNGGKIEGWASGDMIAVRPSEVYSTWDPRLQGKTAVHREYGDTGEKTVRENNKPKVTDVKTGKQYDPEEEIEKMYSDPEYIAQMQRMGREEGRGWPKRNTGEKTVREEKWAKLPSGDYRNMDTGRAYAKKGGGPDNGGNSSYMTPEYLISEYKKRIAEIEAGPYKRPREVAQLQKKIAKLSGQRSYMLNRDGKETTDTDDGRNYSGMIGNNRWNE